MGEERDRDLLFRWRNDPSSVEASPSGEVPYESHCQWYARKLANPQTIFFICLSQGQLETGMVRFDHKGDDSSEISIIINPELRGQGWGKKLLHKCCQLFFQNFKHTRILARILPSNEASKKIFLGVGFELLERIGDSDSYQLTRPG